MFNYDKAMANGSSVFPNVELKIDEYGESRLMTDFKQRVINDDDELFRVVIKNYNKEEEKIVHAEDIAEFCFDEKDYQTIILIDPIKGKDLIA